MTDHAKSRRFIFRTKGVCPPEIHFQIGHGVLEDLRFVGGGCTGNAKIVARLLKGRPIEEVLPYLDGIVCRNGTSCSQQLHTALKAARDRRLAPTDSFRIHSDAHQNHRIGLIAGLGGDYRALADLLTAMTSAELDAIYCMGNLTGVQQNNKQLLKALRNAGIPAILGETDWQVAQTDATDASMPQYQGLDQDFGKKIRDWLLQSPHVLSFKLENKKGMAFYGEYIQNLPGFSDFEPFALEMNMVCGLTDYMRDQTVFPALEAMIPQFEADIILFCQPHTWGHWHLTGKDFISLGPAVEPKQLAWGMLSAKEGIIEFKPMRIEREREGI
jgi:uncharacterized protein (TIGR03905 family)